MMSGRSVPTDFQTFAVGGGAQGETKQRGAGNLFATGESRPGQYLAALPGLTGDVYGALCEATEALVLIVLVAVP